MRFCIFPAAVSMKIPCACTFSSWAKDFRKYMQVEMVIRREESFIMHILSNDG